MICVKTMHYLSFYLSCTSLCSFISIHEINSIKMSVYNNAVFLVGAVLDHLIACSRLVDNCCKYLKLF